MQGLMPDDAKYEGTFDYLEPRENCEAYAEMMFFCCNPFRSSPACDPANKGCKSPNPIGREAVCEEYYVNASDCGGPKNSYHVMDMCCDYEWRCGPSKAGWCGFNNIHGHGMHNHPMVGKTREEIAGMEAEEKRMERYEAEEKRMFARHKERVRRAEERLATESPATGWAFATGPGGSWSRSRFASFLQFFTPR